MSKDSFNEVFQKGLHHFSNQEYRESIWFFRRAIIADPDSLLGLTYMVKSHYHLNKRDDFDAYAKIAFEKDPTYPDLVNFYAECLVNDRKMDEAVQFLKEKVVDPKQNLEGLLKLIAIEHHQDAYDDVITHAQTYISINPLNRVLNEIYTNAFVRKRDYKELIKAIATLPLQGFTEQIYLSLAAAYISQNNYTQAEHVYKAGIEHNSKSSDLKNWLTKLLLEERRYDEAVAVSTQLLHENSDDAVARTWFGYAKEMRDNDIQTAKESYLAAIYILQNDSTYYDFLLELQSTGQIPKIDPVKLGQSLSTINVDLALKEGYPLGRLSILEPCTESYVLGVHAELSDTQKAALEEFSHHISGRSCLPPKQLYLLKKKSDSR